MPISSTNALGLGDLLDKIYEHFPNVGVGVLDNPGISDNPEIHVAIIGKPNVGKSSLINKILNEDRVIVSDSPGTTRDAVDTYFSNEHGKYLFIDTAGVRRHNKRRKTDENVEKYSVLRTMLAIERADVCLLVIDGTEGVTEQDTKVAGEAHEAR